MPSLDRAELAVLTVFWDLTLASFSSSVSWRNTHTHTHLYTMLIHWLGWVGGSVQVSSWPILLFFRPTVSPHPTHTQCHPTPSSINASNPLCGRVTSATVRNRVKLNRHQEKGEERERGAPQITKQTHRASTGTLPPRGDLCFFFSKGRECSHASSLRTHRCSRLQQVGLKLPCLRGLVDTNSKDESWQSGIQTHLLASVNALRERFASVRFQQRLLFIVFYYPAILLGTAALTSKQMARRPPSMSGVSERCLCEPVLNVYERL